MPQKLTAYGGIDTLVHALESYVSIFATDYTKGLSREAVALTLKFLPRAYTDGAHDYEARERIHSAATIAGMAFANAFLGVCHSMAHKLGARFHVPHGLANAALISHVIRYNASDRPMKQVGQPGVGRWHLRALRRRAAVHSWPGLVPLPGRLTCFLPLCPSSAGGPAAVRVPAGQAAVC